LTKRQCLTCAYFEKAPTDGFGWCHHPTRKSTSDIKIYIRAASIDCRNDWNHDLYEAAATFTGTVDFGPKSGSGPLAPANIDDMVFLTANHRAGAEGADAAPAQGSAVDLVIREESAIDPPSLAPRGSIRMGAVRRAHQQVLAERQVDRFADGAPPAPDGGFSTPVQTTAPAPSVEDRVYEADRLVGGQGASYSATRPVFSPVPPVRRSEMDRSIPTKIAIYPGDEDRFSSVPKPIDGLAIPVAPPRESGEGVIRSSFTEYDHAEDVWPAEPKPTPRVQTATVAADDRPVLDRRPANEEAPLLDARAVDSPDVDLEATAEPEFVDDGQVQDYAPPSRRHGRRGGLFRARRKPVVEPLDDNDEIWDDIPEVTAVERAVDVRISVPPLERRIEPVVERKPEPAIEQNSNGFADLREPLQTALWANVPRMCRTCRDFRPAETGDRGWCTNKWAFNHRRMVDADEMPCESSVGCWWLPHDDIWLEIGDISAHGQPTPLLDLWLGQRHGRDLDLEEGPVRRRQRG
jgi:hypothetical protein